MATEEQEAVHNLFATCILNATDNIDQYLVSWMPHLLTLAFSRWLWFAVDSSDDRVRSRIATPNRIFHSMPLCFFIASEPYSLRYCWVSLRHSTYSTSIEQPKPNMNAIDPFWLFTHVQNLVEVEFPLHRNFVWYFDFHPFRSSLNRLFFLLH